MRTFYAYINTYAQKVLKSYAMTSKFKIIIVGSRLHNQVRTPKALCNQSIDHRIGTGNAHILTHVKLVIMRMGDSQWKS